MGCQNGYDKKMFFQNAMILIFFKIRFDRFIKVQIKMELKIQNRSNSVQRVENEQKSFERENRLFFRNLHFLILTSGEFINK